MEIVASYGVSLPYIEKHGDDDDDDNDDDDDLLRGMKKV